MLKTGGACATVPGRDGLALAEAADTRTLSKMMSSIAPKEEIPCQAASVGGEG